MVLDTVIACYLLLTFGSFCKIHLTLSAGHANSADVNPPTVPQTAAFRPVFSFVRKLFCAQPFPEKAKAETGVANMRGVNMPRYKPRKPCSDIICLKHWPIDS